MITKNITPDTITIPEAVKALVEYFETAVIEAYIGDRNSALYIYFPSELPAPSHIKSIVYGYSTPAAVKVGLEDLFVSILMDAKEAAS